MAGETKKDKSERAGLRPAQIAAAGLAAVTAAFLGSTLGVYGTVLGAGLVSVLTTVGSELYLRSLDRTREATKKARAVATAVSSARGWQTRIGPAAARGTEPTRITEQPTMPTVRMPVPGATVAVDEGGADDVPGSDDSEARTTYLAPPVDKPALWKRRWPWLVATSAVAFVIGIAALTGFEGVTGKSLTGGDGVTVGKFLGNSASSRNGGGDEQAPVDETPATTEQQQPGGDGEDDSTATTEQTEPSTPESTESSEPTESETTTEPSEPTQTEQPTETDQNPGGEAGGGAAEPTETP